MHGRRADTGQVPPPPPPSGSLQSAGTTEPEVPLTAPEKHIRAVQAHYSDFILSLPEAVGHGIGPSQTGSGQPVIFIDLREATEEAIRAIPRKLDDVPVEWMVVGEFKFF